MHLILNDLSSQFPVANQYQAREVMAVFLKAYQAARSVTGSSNLIVDRDYNHISLAVGYCIEQWRNDHAVDIEDKRAFRSLIQRSDTYDSFPIEDTSEFNVDSCECFSTGCQLAYLLSGCCLSFLCHKKWDVPFIKGRYRFLNEDTDQIDDQEVCVPNIASWETAAVFSQTYGEKVKQESRASFTSGEDILNRANEFPNLSFCENAKAQLSAERGRYSVSQIARRLIELQKYFETAVGAFDAQQLNHCTPESKATLEQYKLAHTFQLPNGEKELFSWHLRFTGEYAGRIFFYPDMASKKCYIGHVGLKLPTVEYPT